MHYFIPTYLREKTYKVLRAPELLSTRNTPGGTELSPINKRGESVS